MIFNTQFETSVKSVKDGLRFLVADYYIFFAKLAKNAASFAK